MDSTTPPGMTEEETRAPRARAVLLSMAAAATVFVAARAYGCSRIMRRRLYAEEWLSVLSLVIVWLNVSFMTTGLYSGLGRHVAALSHEQQVRAKFLYTVGTPFSVYVCSLHFTASSSGVPVLRLTIAVQYKPGRVQDVGRELAVPDLQAGRAPQGCHVGFGHPVSARLPCRVLHGLFRL